MKLKARRTLLFAPGDRVEVHAKALASGADVVCLDLEDAVALDRKDAARRAALPFLLSGEGSAERALRINSPRSAEGLRDLLGIIEAAPAQGVLFLPKVSSAEEVGWVEELLDEAGLGLRLGVLVESVAGLERASSIMRASSRIAFAMFGGADLSAELGVGMDDHALHYARSRVVHGARLAGIDVFDVPSLAFRDLDQVAREAAYARAMGFTGKGVIHPSNVAVVNDAFKPSQTEIERARKVMEAYRASPNGLAVVDGKLVERPVVRSMERILALAEITRNAEN